jgi:hypothetical protein
MHSEILAHIWITLAYTCLHCIAYFTTLYHPVDSV